MQQADAETRKAKSRGHRERETAEVQPSRDDDLRRAIQEKLSRNMRLGESVQVSVADRSAVLEGVVETAYDRIAAHNAAWFTPGVIAVDNHLRVRQSESGRVSQKSSDLALQSLLGDVFRRHPDLDERKITPIVHGHIVTLWGTCDAYWKKLRAQEAAETSADFGAVRDHLAIVPSGDLDDERIGEGAMQALSLIPGVDAEYVVVRVEPGGVVILSGTVADEDAREGAVAAVEGIPGVKRVTAKELITDSSQTVI